MLFKVNRKRAKNSPKRRSAWGKGNALMIQRYTPVFGFSCVPPVMLTVGLFVA